MIYTRHLYDPPTLDIDYVQYFGEDVEKFPARQDIKNSILKSINKECTTPDGYSGIIVGVEDNHSYNDYYYIIWVPESGKMIYELVNGMSRYIKQ